MLRALTKNSLNKDFSSFLRKCYFIEWVVLMMSLKPVDVRRRTRMIASLLCPLSSFYTPSDGRAAAENL